jgi:hypothetical protein
MADFNQTREQLRQSREQRAAADSGIAAAREQLKHLAAQQAALDRGFNANDPNAVEQRDELAKQIATAKGTLDEQQSARAKALTGEVAVLGQWAAFTDPQKGIAQLSDGTPILMMPVRLETRFKNVPMADAPGRPGAVAVEIQPIQPELWVRVYPDDCWIDTFDPVLTDSEVAAAKDYWEAIWEAGQDPDQERGAWRVLASSKGSGRAAWIIQTFVPAGAPPKKAHPQDVVLTIPTETPLGAEEAATTAYWSALWAADGDATKSAAAQATFEGKVGKDRAKQIAAQYQPVNFSTPLPTGVQKKDVQVTTALVVFPAISTKESAWSRAPRVDILPDRFVFIGYDGVSPNPVVKVGNPVPSPLFTGPDPSAPAADQLQHDGAGGLKVPDQLQWMSDFDRAVKDGMGFSIPLTEQQATKGFTRVLVVGLRLNADQKQGQSELETLLQHHFFTRPGLALLAQGTPTNNTDAAPAGHSRLDDPDQSFDDLQAPLFTPKTSWLEKRDGQWVAEYLGLDPALFAHVHNAGGTDQIAARAMNIAMWPATLGYWMETMMSPVFSPAAVDATRDFFSQYVLAEGAAPALRIGNQPYGILPCTAFTRMEWLNPVLLERRLFATPQFGFLQQLYAILKAMESDWRAIAASLPFTGSNKVTDPHAALLDIVGLHSGSVEWSQRYAESLETLYNRLAMLGFGGLIQYIITAVQRAQSRGLLTALGYAGSQDPSILDKVFDQGAYLLKGGVVDDQPLSESAGIRVYTTDGRNYIQWLIDAAHTSLDALYQQNGFKDDKPPAALLFLMLRHALQLGYHDVSLRLYETAGLYTKVMVTQARSDYPFLHVEQSRTVSESRYQPLYAVAPQITGNNHETVADFITSRLVFPAFDFYLPKQLDALDRLKSEPTGRLERVFADHVDCCSYRLDAWLLALVNYQLTLMRGIQDGGDAPVRQGIYLGAYAWLEDLKPKNKVLTPVELEAPVLRAEFQAPGDPPLVSDNTNEGYIHAPSLNHAVTAAILRNGFISDASPANRQTMAVNLTSERVRVALGLLQGIRAGQGMADLLGYQFERGLHDRHSFAEVDQFIYKLRKAFPLRADRIQDTRTDEGVPIESIEARNVIDGLALAEHMKATGQTTYKFGKDFLPDASPDQAAAINAEADLLLQSYDATADLALAEGVFQAVMGNSDRVASTYDAYAKGNFPPEPDVIRTPFRGVGLTHRVAVQWPSGVSPNVTPIAGVDMTPRAEAEPGLNQWLAKLLPPLDQVGCVATFRAAAGGMTSPEVTLKDLKLQPADLIAIISDENQQLMTELDDRIVGHVFRNHAVRPDVSVTIQYMQTKHAQFSVFEVMPLVRNLRRLATKSRPLRSSDLSLGNEAFSTQDKQPFVDKTRLDLVKTQLEKLQTDLTAFQGVLDPLLADLTAHRADILAQVDDFVDQLAPLMMRAATFTIVQAGLGFAYDFKRRTYSAILQQAADLVQRWDDKLTDFDNLVAQSHTVATDKDKFDLLAQAERTISTQATSPLPATPADYETMLTTVKQPAFVAKRDQFDQLNHTHRTKVSLLLADVQALLPITGMDFKEFSLTARGDEMVFFTQDMQKLVKTVLGEIARRLKETTDQFKAYDNAAAATDQVAALEEAAKALLGPAYRLFPEFPLDATQGSELSNALAASNPNGLFKYLMQPPDPGVASLDFPVDTWLYGVARVRDKMHNWEQTVMYAGAMGQAEPELTAMQLPFTPDERWFALEFPAAQAVDKDHLLYTAHFAAAFDPSVNQCGLLVDEWNEIIPGSSADTGLTFHFDRPNNEAPQSMLLVTPANFQGAWQWRDLVDALNDTLDLAKTRAVEPKHIDASPYAPFLPATIMASQVYQLTIALNLALNNRVETLVREK